MTALLTVLAMLAFAGNSVLCRLALGQTSIDAASFTAVRLLSGALMLTLLVYFRRLPTPASGKTTKPRTVLGGNWTSALALFVYAGAFSFAYLKLSTGTGALLLFGAVQATMILTGLWSGERLSGRQMLGLLLAVAGLVAVLLPGLTAPPLGSALLMLASGVAWGIYSLRGRGVSDPTRATAGNFLRASVLSVLLGVGFLAQQNLDGPGLWYAVLSGALASGVGYAVWYAALRGLTMTSAASVQLSVPVLAALAGAAFLQEPITLRLALTSVAILGGIALVVLGKKQAPAGG